MATTSALIAGGGIGGLCAALCLADKGIKSTVFEQARQFEEAGAGIQLSPNCTRVLHRLGLERALRSSAFLPRGAQFRHYRTGKVISESPLGEAVQMRYGFPYYHIHRGDLLNVLVAAARATPLIELVPDHRVERFAVTQEGVTVPGRGREYSADVLIGADGIHSAVRGELFGADAAVFTGNVAWRMLVPAQRLPKDMVRPMSTVWWGPGKHFVHYYVRGGELVNCVCVVETPGWETESWTEPGDVSELRDAYAGWHPDIGALIDHCDPDSLYKWALHDRPPMSRWSRGRVSLLGDACHPTLPFMAQGAAMAIEDGAVLARCLHAGSDVAASLQAYEKLRKPRTAQSQRRSRRNARFFHLRGVQAWARNRGAGLVGDRMMDALFSYDALSAGEIAEH